MVLTHAPFDPTPDSKLWDPKRMGSATINGDLGNIQENFADMMKYMDQDMGKIVHKLDSLGIRENTLILFMGDNGTAASIKSKWSGLQIQGGKYTLNDNGVRVPFLVSWPKYIKEGFVSPELVDAADIFPTLMQAAKVNLPLNYTHDGRSLLSTLLRQPGRSKEYVSVEDGKKDRMVRTLNYSWSLIGTSYEFRYHPGTLQPTTLLDINKLTADQQKVWAFLKTKMTENTNFSASKTPFPPDTHKVNYPPPVGVAIYNSRVGTKNTDGLEIRLNKKDKNSLEIWVPRLTTGNLVLTLYSSSGRVVYKARKTALPVEVQGRAYSQINWNKASNIGMPLGKGRYLISVTNTDHVGGQKAANWRTSIDL
jgi:hypothetical protein